MNNLKLINCLPLKFSFNILDCDELPVTEILHSEPTDKTGYDTSNLCGHYVGILFHYNIQKGFLLIPES